MLTVRNTWIATALLGAVVPTLCAQDGIPTEQFHPLRELIRPQPGESHWREIDWHTSLQEARLQAAAEGKPILLWSGGGAPPLGGC